MSEPVDQEVEALQNAHDQMQAVYNQHAAAWHRRRLRNLYERPWLEKTLEGLPRGSRVIDLGCGSGDPVARYLDQQGFSVTGVDYSSSMISIARRELPHIEWVEADMTQFRPKEPVSAVISWDGFFHLTRKDQEQLLPRLADALLPGGRLLLTVGHGDGEVLGWVEGDAVYHASLSPDAYQSILSERGMVTELKLNDEATMGRSVLLAKKTETPRTKPA